MCIEKYQKKLANNRLELKINEEDKDYIFDVAKRLGVSASQFIKTTALNEAKKVERDYLIPKGK
jgi:uncharacterized protein (DUF1778 family)